MKTALLLLIMTLSSIVVQGQVFFTRSWNKTVDSSAVPVQVRHMFNHLVINKDEVVWNESFSYDSVSSDKRIIADTVELRKYIKKHHFRVMTSSLLYDSTSAKINSFYCYKVRFWQDNRSGFMQFLQNAEIQQAQFEIQLQYLPSSVQKPINKIYKRLKINFKNVDVSVTKFIDEDKEKSGYYATFYIPEDDGKHLTQYDTVHLNAKGTVIKNKKEY